MKVITTILCALLSLTAFSQQWIWDSIPFPSGEPNAVTETMSVAADSLGRIYVGGSSNTVWFSDDLGLTWDSTSFTSQFAPSIVNDIEIHPDGTLLVSSENSGGVHVSTDRGQTFTQISSNGSGNCFIAPNGDMYYHENNYLIRSSDKGVSDTVLGQSSGHLAADKNGNLYKLISSNNNGAKVYFSSDRGANWTLKWQDNPSSSSYGDDKGIIITDNFGVFLVTQHEIIETDTSFSNTQSIGGNHGECGGVVRMGAQYILVDCAYRWMLSTDDGPNITHWTKSDVEDDFVPAGLQRTWNRYTGGEFAGKDGWFYVLSHQRRLIRFKYDTGSATKLEELAKIKIELYPNPAMEELHIATDSKIIRVDVYNTDGRNVLSTSGRNLDVTTLSEGYYICYIYTDAGSVRKNFVVFHP